MNSVFPAHNSLSCPTLYQEALLHPCLWKEKKDIKAPAKQLFHKGWFLMMIPKAWGISYIIFPPSRCGEACPRCPFLEHSYTPILPCTCIQAEFPLGKKHVTCIFGILMLPHARVLAKFSQADTQLQRVPFPAGSPCR